MIITVEQIRAARALLNWKQTDLARESKVSLASINNLERNIGSPRMDTMRAIEETFKNSGIEFIGQEGVRKHSDFFAITEYNGKDFLKDWMEDFTSCMTEPGDTVLVCGLDERNFPRYAPDQLLRYLDHQKKSGFVEKILIQDGDDFLLAPPESYRWISPELWGTVPYLVYKDRFVMAMYEANRMIVIRNHAIANTFRKQFESLWDMSKPLPNDIPNQMNDPDFEKKWMKPKK